MKIKLTKKDLELSQHYGDNENCLLATALKRRGHKNVRVSAFCFHANGKRYNIPTNLACRLAENYTLVLNKTYEFELLNY